MSPRSNQKTSTWSAVNFKKSVTSMSCRLEPVIWSHDTGQQITCFDRCQLLITWMSNIKEVHSKPRLHVCTVSTCLKYGRHIARLHRRRRRRAYAPTSNTAAHDGHEKINSWVSFSVCGYGAPLGGPSGRRSSAMKTWHFSKLAWHYQKGLLESGLHHLQPSLEKCSDQTWRHHMC